MKVQKTLFVLAFAPALFSAETTLNFNPASPGTGPFPSDALTVSDAAQKTGKRINLPFAQNCQGQPTSDCLDTLMLNQLDGFSLAPRLQLCFSGGDAAPSTIPQGLFVIALNQPSRMIRVTQ